MLRGGENTLHAHNNEDHMFVILQGTAIFHGPKGEKKEIGSNEGIMLPAGALYNFTCTSGTSGFAQGGLEGAFR